MSLIRRRYIGEVLGCNAARAARKSDREGCRRLGRAWQAGGMLTVPARLLSDADRSAVERVLDCRADRRRSGGRAGPRRRVTVGRRRAGLRVRQPPPARVDLLVGGEPHPGPRQSGRRRRRSPRWPPPTRAAVPRWSASPRRCSTCGAASTATGGRPGMYGRASRCWSRRPRRSVPADPTVRLVRPHEMDVLFPAAVAMYTEEVGISPLTGGGGRDYRDRVGRPRPRPAGLREVRRRPGRVQGRAGRGHPATPPRCRASGSRRSGAAMASGPARWRPSSATRSDGSRRA